MTVTALEFGKTLRPTTVELVTKLNETIAALQATTTDLTEKVTTNTGSITTLTQTQATHTQDIDKMKVTLYTPLANPDTDPSTPAKEI